MKFKNVKVKENSEHNHLKGKIATTLQTPYSPLIPPTPFLSSVYENKNLHCKPNINQNSPQTSAATRICCGRGIMVYSPMTDAENVASCFIGGMINRKNTVLESNAAIFGDEL